MAKLSESILFQPIMQKSITFRNRIVVSPMCQYSATDGFANDWHLVHLGSRAVGGAALVMAEATAVQPRGRISPHDLGIWHDEHIKPLKAITDFIKSQGSVPAIQLAHAGRKASTQVPWKGGRFLIAEEGGWQVVSASSLPYSDRFGTPHALTTEEIGELVNDFKEASVRALKAGFQLIEIHAAHGYLLHQFLSPCANQRTDAYGGSFENRTRLLMEVIDAVKSVWPADYPLWVRISATDWLEHTSDPSWTLTDSVKLAHMLKEVGVDTIDVSSGGMSPKQRITTGPGYQVPFSETIKNEIGIPTAAVGLITEAKQAEAILQEGKADFVALARELLRDPYWPLHAATTLGVDLPWPDQYARAKI